ncbi:MAG: ketopantoate reductase family protein [Chloroflexi bacterium]|nr:ketopantoate reductase family protein [Chloroflexota bacterium]
MTDEPWLIVGTGAMAGLFAARLAAAGESVMMLGTWRAALDALRTHGLRWRDERGREQTYPVRVADPEGPLAARGALVLVKAWQTERVAQQLAARLPATTPVLTLQNGLGPQDVLRAALGAARVTVGVTTYAARVLAPGMVQATGSGSVDLARTPQGAFWAAALRRAGFVVHMHEDVRGLLWGKLAINAAINPLTALLDVPNGALLDDPAARLFMAQAAREVARVAAAQGIALPFDDPVARAFEVARRTAANSSSMREDLRRGAPTEIDAICGAVARRGREVGQPAPLNEALWMMVREAVTRRRAVQARTLDG